MTVSSARRISAATLIALAAALGTLATAAAHPGTPVKATVQADGSGVVGWDGTSS